MSLLATPIADRISTHLRALAEVAPARPPGAPSNLAATSYVEAALRAAGMAPSSLSFRARFWQPGRARIELDGRVLEVEPPPFCRSASTRGPAISVETPGELARLAAEPGAVIVLRGNLAAEPYFPKAFPFVSFAEQQEVLAALAALQPAAVLAVVADERAAEPIFEDPDLEFVYATIPASVGVTIAPGAEVGLQIDAAIDEGQGVNISAGATSGPRAVVCAHVDSKVTTPGLLDNGGGVAVLLALAETGVEGLGPLELVFFNGEDHYAAPGEQAWLAARDLVEVELVINVDGAGLVGHRCAVSTLGASAGLEERIDGIVGRLPRLEIGPPWFESDHAVFAMRGIPTIAITSAGDVEALKRIAHAPDEALDRVDAHSLAEIVTFIREGLAGRT